LLIRKTSIFRAYCELLAQMPQFLRGCNNNEVIDSDLLLDLANAMHNIAGTV
jgi:hypothetical protein